MSLQDKDVLSELAAHIDTLEHGGLLIWHDSKALYARLTEEITSLRSELARKEEALKSNEAASSFAEDAAATCADLARKWAKEITGGNCAFVDDDLRLLANLADRAVKAGLTDGLPESVLRSIARQPSSSEVQS